MLDPSIVRSWVDASSRIVALTGAGISTESGIPDFRGPQGVWTKNPKAEQLSNIHDYMADPEVRRLAWQGRLHHPAWTATPRPGHRALVDLERRGTLHALVTQNIDGLHQRAGSSPDLVIEVHGTIHDVDVHGLRMARPDGPGAGSAARGRRGSALHRVRRDPQERDDLVRPGAGAARHRTRDAWRLETADLLLAVGTSLQVYPIAGAVPAARAAGARVVIVNAEPTPFDEVADAVLRGRIGELLPALVT